MQFFMRWRNALTVRIALAQSTGTASVVNRAEFHSAPIAFEKRKNKSDSDVRGNQPPLKDYIRFSVRQKRADTKKALKSILLNGSCSTSRIEPFSKIEDAFTEQLNKRSRIKSSRKYKKTKIKKANRNNNDRKENLFADDEDNDTYRIFHASFSKQGFTWRFRHSATGFEWRDPSNWDYGKFHETESRNKIDSDGYYMDRKILGLPTAGPLYVNDVKAAFRESALKWHPDKHQGPSQGDAEEKFKKCVSAYKSLCSALSAP